MSPLSWRLGCCLDLGGFEVIMQVGLTRLKVEEKPSWPINASRAETVGDAFRVETKGSSWRKKKMLSVPGGKTHSRKGKKTSLGCLLLCF